ncbi:RNA 3'-terminal phosphate cyclase [Natrialbaceae archaeon AArc-T1-2]|uniref:RNA 3'-terminal phosphate cyclase n=1 Tax=Natrialbaceae archaeon AArc-T1-2 TaxID=3053904 RepID=UPI00255B3605|nr:RNA 3'-terminal phosphate cyclase [Natrialbaceae archaeon AArc-T1-2]WIV65873.1 RNA 3'-terminal phosphate cyclase [Natrialbaceae archaeon AArc-T1-2]
MRELDGSEAGGQFVRSALALAALEDDPVRIENVRGNRSTPGLRPQHLAALETMASVCDADVTGAEVGAEAITFEPDPGSIPGGEYAVDIGTAGSITLLFQTLVPLATRLDTPLSVTVTGGTDVKWSPPLDYVRYVTLPLLARYGIEAEVELERRGFYPAGGGEATLHLSPSSLAPIELEERDELEAVRVYSTEANALEDSDVAKRQTEGALERLATDEYGLEVRDRVETTAASDCPGSALVVVIEGGRTRAGFTALGERGKPAERVGEDVADAANRFLEGDAPVDRHMGDQLLVFLALAGGRLTVPAITDHVETSLELLASFEYDVGLEDETTVVARDRPE